MPVSLDAEIVGQFARMGHHEDASDPGPETDQIEIMAQAVASFRIWKAVETQWRVIAGPGGIAWNGIDYVALDVVLRRTRIENPDDVFADIMMMEAEALAAFSEVEE